MARSSLIWFLIPSFLAAADFGTESPDSLLRKDNHMKPLAPFISDKGKLPDYNREMVRVQWREDDHIYLFVVTPPNVKKAPVILYLYNFPAESDRFLDPEFCKLMVKDGFAAVGFVSALTGQRYHDRPMKEWFVSELKESLVDTAHDVSMIIDYLETRPDIDATRVGMYGEGSGGAIAVLAAASDPRLKVIDLMDAWGDWPDWFAKSTTVPEEERPGFLKPDFLKTVDPYDPVRFLPKLTGIPIRYQYLTRPKHTPQDAREKIVAALPPGAVNVPYKEAVAAFRASNGRATFDWLKSQPVLTNSVMQHDAPK